jgi:membrane associated rhomboid family serine protease
MARGRGFGGHTRVGQFRIPVVVALLMAVTTALSIAGAICERNGIPLVQWGAFLPELVWRGQVWRLVTWVFYEMSPLNLVFYLVVLYWLGRDLVQQWGAARFLGLYLGLAAVSAGLTCLIGRFVWEPAFASAQLGSWAVTDGLIIAWALYNPTRQINLYMVIPVTGRSLVWITLGGTVLYALFSGLPPFIPHFLCEGIMLLYVGQLRRWWLQLKMTRLQKQKQRYVNNVIRMDRDEERSRKDAPESKPPKYLN